MQRRPIRRVAIAGDGPAGTTLAALLARGGVRVALFARGRPAGLVVGESLVPAVVPVLRALGVEEEVRAYGVWKPGATFVPRDGEVAAFHFADTARRVPGYAYNVPRDRFDATLLDAARRSGAHVVPQAARITRDPDAADRVRLAGASAEAATEILGGAPDLIVDATGHAALLARLQGLPAEEGDRRDAALFAHCEGVPLDSPGHVHMDHLANGWCWRIPVGPQRVSLGIVVRPEVAASHGDDAATQFDGLCVSDARLAQLLAAGRRVSPVVRYGNYQRTFRRGVGPGWALVGDAFGFVDPIFSSGLLLAMDGARSLAAAVRAGTPRAFQRYEARTLRDHAAWRGLVARYYDGRIFDLVRLRHEDPSLVGRIVSRHVGKHLSRALTGESTGAPYSRWLLEAVIRHALPHEPSALRIR